MVITKPQGMLLLVALTGLGVVARAGPIVDMLLLLLAGLMLLELLARPQLPERVRWVLFAFVMLFLIYLTLTGLRPSRTGIVNVVGVAISGICFLYFVQTAPRLIAAQGTARILWLSGGLIGLAGVALDMVNKNTISGVVTYFLLAAGVVCCARGVPLRRVSLWMLLALMGLGVAMDHRMIMAVSLVLALVIALLRLLPMRLARNMVLIGLIGGVGLMIALFAGLWGLDIRDLDALFIEYTGRTARSGRQIIWPLIIAATAESPWLGLGTGTTFSQLYDTSWSAHSYYLQIYMQAGLVGVAGLILVLLALWNAIGRPRRSEPLRLYMTGCLVVLILHASFEVFLMQVNLLMGCTAWMMMGLGVGALRRPAAPPAAAPLRFGRGAPARVARPPTSPSIASRASPAPHQE